MHCTYNCPYPIRSLAEWLAGFGLVLIRLIQQRFLALCHSLSFCYCDTRTRTAVALDSEIKISSITIVERERERERRRASRGYYVYVYTCIWCAYYSSMKLANSCYRTICIYILYTFTKGTVYNFKMFHLLSHSLVHSRIFKYLTPLKGLHLLY